MALINSEPDRQHSLMSAFSYLKKPFTNKIALLLTALLCTFILISCEAAALEANPTTSDLTITDLTDAVQLQLTDPAARSRDRVVKKTEKDGLYAALDVGCVWLERALAGK